MDWARTWNRHKAIDPTSADVALPATCMAVVVNGDAGTVALQDGEGTSRTYAAATIAALGGVIPGQWSKVLQTGTTATGIICWYRSIP